MKFPASGFFTNQFPLLLGAISNFYKNSRPKQKMKNFETESFSILCLKAFGLQSKRIKKHRA
jgi:hypothetical protein